MEVDIQHDGKPYGFAKVTRDMTQRHSKEEATLRENERRFRLLAEERVELLKMERETRLEAEEANRLKDRFLALVSHELRTPLTPIIGWTNLLRSRALHPEQFEKAIETIDRNIQLQLRIVDDLLDVSKAVAGKIEMHFQLVHVETIVQEAVYSLQGKAKAEGLEMGFKIETQILPVPGVSPRLFQVFTNLLWEIAAR